MTELATFVAMRYVAPLREGGSLPAIVDTDGGAFVVKFRGAGQGAKALVAELIAGLLAAQLDLPTPELALIDVPEPFGRSEPDPEIQDLLRGSHGINVGLRYLDGAFNFALSAAGHLITPDFAARLVWLDAFLTNPDRTHRNPNLLVWQRRVWLIDHGAALYAHHDWDRVDEARSRAAFPLIRDHVLLAVSSDLEAMDAALAERFSDDVITEVLRQIPDALLVETPAANAAAAAAARDRYHVYLRHRLREPRAFTAEAAAARQKLITKPLPPLSARR